MSCIHTTHKGLLPSSSPCAATGNQRSVHIQNNPPDVHSHTYTHAKAPQAHVMCGTATSFVIYFCQHGKSRVCCCCRRYGPSHEVLRSPAFWITQIATYSLTFGSTYAIRASMWLFAPQDSMVLSEREAQVR